MRGPDRPSIPSELLAFCETRLPYFALPRYVDVLPDLPRTENGKVQKYKLRERGVTSDDLGPRSPLGAKGRPRPEPRMAAAGRSSTVTFSLAGRAAFVTGAARGLGAAIARGLAEAGARVALADVDAAVDGVAGELRDAGHDCIACGSTCASRPPFNAASTRP